MKSFAENGFALIRHAARHEVIEEVRARLENLLPEHAGDGPTPLQRLVPRMVEHDEHVVAFATDAQLITLLTEIFGVVPQLVCSYGHDKPAGTDTHTGPHSDVGHLPGIPHHLSLLMVKAMLALTPVRQGMGGTLIFPGSHQEPLPSCDEQGYYVSLDPGDLLLFNANLRHTATSNPSAQRRLSIWFVYALPWMRTFPGYEFTADFLQRQQPRIANDPNLRILYGLIDPYAT